MNKPTRDESYIRAVYTGNAHPPLDEKEAEHEFDRILTKVKAEAWDAGRQAEAGYTWSLADWNRKQREGFHRPEPEPPENPHR